MADKNFDEFTRQAFREEIGDDPVSATRGRNPKMRLPYTALGIPSLMVREVPSLRGTNVAGMVFSDPRIKNMDLNRQYSQAVFVSPDAGDTTVGHELEHLLARQNLGHPAQVRDTFKQLLGQGRLTPLDRSVTSIRGTAEFLDGLKEALPYIKEKYQVSNAYLTPEFIDKQGERGLYEILATLGGIESAQNVDLTRDPTLRKSLFKDRNVRETYNAVTGLRQTRTDAKDLPSYTRLPEDPSLMGKVKDVFGFENGGAVPHAGRKRDI